MDGVFNHIQGEANETPSALTPHRLTISTLLFIAPQYPAVTDETLLIRTSFTFSMKDICLAPKSELLCRANRNREEGVLEDNPLKTR